MGTRKSSNEKKASSAAAIQNKPTSNGQKANSVPHPSKSRRRQFVKKRWEKWEDQLVVKLHKEGKNDAQISQYLPGRSPTGCRNRWYYYLKNWSQNFSDSTQEKGVLAFPGPRKHFWQKEWEDWEDRIIITQRSAGETWGSISKLLPLRTTGSVIDRWKRANLVVEPRPHESVDLQTQSPNISSIPRRVRYSCRWERGEEQLLKSLRDSGKGFAEIAGQIPNRSTMSCKRHWYESVGKTQGQSTKSTAKPAPPWEEWEERLLVSGHHAGVSWKEISQPITRRTADACLCQWSKFFASPDQDESWTPEELALLTYLRWEGSGWDDISQELPGHTSNACRRQWYRETEGIQGPSNHQGKHYTWSTEEVEVLVGLYNTIGPRWQEISKHIPGRTSSACERWLLSRCTKEDGKGGPPSEFWKVFFMGKLYPWKFPCTTMFQADSVDETEPGVNSDSMEDPSDDHIRDEFLAPRLTRNQQASVDARKRKVIDIPMV